MKRNVSLEEISDGRFYGPRYGTGGLRRMPWLFPLAPEIPYSREQA